jgi:hypothetical protein
MNGPSPTESRTTRPLKPRSVGLRVACSLLVVVLGITLVGCGDKQSAGAKGEGVGDAFATKALAVCQSAQKSKDAWSAFPVPNFDPSRPEAQGLPKVGTWLEEEVSPTFDTWLNDLRALGTPPKGRAAWADVLKAVTRIRDLNAAQVDAAKEHDTDAFAQATSGLGQVQPELEDAAAEAGVAKCAEVHAG